MGCSEPRSTPFVLCFRAGPNSTLAVVFAKAAIRLDEIRCGPLRRTPGVDQLHTWVSEQNRVNQRSATLPRRHKVAPAEIPSPTALRLSGGLWKVSAETLGSGRFFMAEFLQENDFTATLHVRPDDVIRAQVIQGTWHVVGSVLFLEWVWEQGDASYREHIPIQIREMAVDHLQGLDKWRNHWDFERLSDSRGLADG